MERTYCARISGTDYLYKSEHRAGSAANAEDAYYGARRRFGGYIADHYEITDIHLATKWDWANQGYGD